MEIVTGEIVKHIGELADTDLTVVDIFADWCKPCQRMLPVLQQLETEVEFEDVCFVKVDADIDSDFCQQMNITSIPTLLMFRQTQLIGRWEGGQDETEIRNWILNTKEEHDV